MPPPIRHTRSGPVLLLLFLAQTAAVPPLRAQDAPPSTGGTLGQVPADFELHGELMLVSGQLTGFEAACGFGLKPNRQELMTWYDHYHLARSRARIEAIYELGVNIGREGPCTAAHNAALVRQWRFLLNRTAAYVETYR